MTTIIRRRKLGMSSVKGISSYSKQDIGWVRSDKPLPDDDLYIRWGCTSNVPTENVLNTAKAIHEVNDKRMFRHKTAKEGLSPETWLTVEDISDNAMEEGVIFRPKLHSRGRNTFHVTSKWRLHELAAIFPEYYISEYVPKVAEYRVAVVCGRVVWVAAKTPGNPKDIAWNVAKGGRFDNVKWGDWNLDVLERV